MSNLTIKFVAKCYLISYNYPEIGFAVDKEENMNEWTQKSVDLTNQEDYLDQLFNVYPITQNPTRPIDNIKKKKIIDAFNKKDNATLVKSLLSLELFPIKDSYVSYLRMNPSAIEKNPKTIDRIANRLYELRLDELLDNCEAPIEANRQCGPLFRKWIENNSLGVKLIKKFDDFLNYKGNCVLCGTDKNLTIFANENLGYMRDKGLDFVGKFCNKYVIAEAKFITDNGGHQNAQFEDAVQTIESPIDRKWAKGEVIKIGILDGIIYIETKIKMHKSLHEHPERTILSSLLLRDFLNSIN